MFRGLMALGFWQDKRYRCVLLALLVFMTAGCRGPNSARSNPQGRVVGTVTSTDGRPLEANFHFQPDPDPDQDKGYGTVDSGRIDMYLPSTEYTVEVYASGHKTVTQKLTVLSEGVTNWSVVLEPEEPKF